MPIVPKTGVIEIEKSKHEIIQYPRTNVNLHLRCLIYFYQW